MPRQYSSDGKRVLPKYLSADKVRVLLATPYKTRLDHTILIGLMAKCGMRVSEAAHVTVEDFDIRESQVTVRQGKGGKDRVLPIDRDLALQVDTYIKQHNLAFRDRLFDITPRAVQSMVKEYGKRAGLSEDVHPHMLRHSFAVNALKSGMSLRTVQKMLGHSRISTTEIYLDLTVDDIKDDYKQHPLPY